MAANPASSGENPAETDARRARVVWAKLGGYPLWPGVTYSSWEVRGPQLLLFLWFFSRSCAGLIGPRRVQELADDGVQGVKQSARLRDTKTIVLFFESFQFQVCIATCSLRSERASWCVCVC